ncbi:quinolinate synthase NadA [Staphylococcus succinus]|uniref:Quinolinate synthase n=1 Tax=Staphylococcus succinus TaxID=61015 RepID=A0ABX5IS88_9STAP|nr:quinolinate synthase NadA [Staphylococcus succinus]PTI70273.1 quinolinate synthase [Staphylococcus succinus]RIN27402.1 quinolinate synthase NadA [Staphylococcus succinus]RIN40575.1 quinolinate synthase NadA [Staphylococcus succinus]RIN45727.1 quinolinate synthase NadA [Staphylococcus succinus]
MFNPILEDAQALPEKYVNMSETELIDKIKAIKETLGSRLFMPTHHYQKDEVAQFADVMGDSLELARICKENTEAEYFIFNGVHFMAETADILTNDNQHIYLPDLSAGCSMADMANIEQALYGYKVLTERLGDDILPLTYVNSTAAIKKFVGENGGSCVTSGNADSVIQWALDQGSKILFLPDQHLGRNTAYKLGIDLDAMAVWNPITKELEYDGDEENISIILWKGHCSVHEKFYPAHVDHARERDPEVNVIVHPECTFEVVEKADYAGSTKYIIDTIKHAPKGSKWVIGTEMNLVHRLKQTYTDIEIQSLNPLMCSCLTMNRIDLPHLAWCLDKIQQGNHDNIIKVDAATTYYAKQSLERMLAIT